MDGTQGVQLLEAESVFEKNKKEDATSHKVATLVNLQLDLQ